MTTIMIAESMERAEYRMNEFKFILEALSSMLAGEGIDRLPYPDARLVYYSAMPSEQQISVLSAIKSYYGACQDCKAEGASLRDAPVLLWKMFRRLGVTPASDLFSYITNESVIEIYNDKSTQVFRNLCFFEVCSYTLEELFCRPWWELYQRDNSITQRLFAAAVNILRGEDRQTTPAHVPVHTLEEVCSPLRFRMDAHHEYLSPLSEDGKIVGYCVLSTVRLHSKEDDNERIYKGLEAYYGSEPEMRSDKDI